MAYFARPLIQMARTAAVAAPAARSYSVAVRQPLRAPVMLAAARPVLSPAAFVRAMGGGGGFIDLEAESFTLSSPAMVTRNSTESPRRRSASAGPGFYWSASESAWRRRASPAPSGSSRDPSGPCNRKATCNGKAALKAYLEGCIASGEAVSGRSMKAHMEEEGKLYREGWTRSCSIGAGDKRPGGDPELRCLYVKCKKRRSCNKQKGGRGFADGQ